MDWQEVCEHPSLKSLPFKIELINMDASLWAFCDELLTGKTRFISRARKNYDQYILRGFA